MWLDLRLADTSLSCFTSLPQTACKRKGLNTLQVLRARRILVSTAPVRVSLQSLHVTEYPIIFSSALDSANLVIAAYFSFAETHIAQQIWSCLILHCCRVHVRAWADLSTLKRVCSDTYILTMTTDYFCPFFWRPYCAGGLRGFWQCKAAIRMAPWILPPSAASAIFHCFQPGFLPKRSPHLPGSRQIQNPLQAPKGGCVQ